MLLEDNLGVANVIKSCLDSWDHSTLHLHNGQAAWEHLNEAAIDLLIVDWKLPGLSGTELVRRVRNSDRHRDLAILMISGQAGREEMVEAYAAGITGFLDKPFTPLQLKEKVDEVWKKAHKPSRAEQLKQACESLVALDPGCTGPLILLGEPTGEFEDLRRDDKKKVADYLIRITTAIDEINAADSEGEKIDCLIDANIYDIMQRTYRGETRERVRLVLLSIDCIGEAPLPVRLIEINKKQDLTIVLVCDDPNHISLSYRSAMNKLGISILARDEMNGVKFGQLIYRDTTHPEGAPSDAESPSVQEIRQRIVDDLETVTYLPSLPKVYQRIMHLAQDSNSDFGEWIDAIRIDPMTSATIIRHAHSPVYGFQGRVDDIERAAILLGKNTIKNLVASEAMQRAFRRVEEQGFLLEDFWLHSATVAYAAFALAFPLQEQQWSAEERAQFQAFRLDAEAIELLKKIDLPGRLKLDRLWEDPFVGGLMHDIGKVVMVQSFPGLFPMLIEQLERYDWAISMSTAEEEVAGGLSHTVVGEILGRRWGLRDRVCQGIGGHHQPAADDAYVFLIGAADIIGQALRPFPLGPRSAVAQALAAKSLNRVTHLLPEGFFDSHFLTAQEFCQLADALSPTIQRLTEEMREAIA